MHSHDFTVFILIITIRWNHFHIASASISLLGTHAGLKEIGAQCDMVSDNVVANEVSLEHPIPPVPLSISYTRLSDSISLEGGETRISHLPVVECPYRTSLSET